MWVERIKYILHNISSTAHTAVTQGLQENYLLSPDILNLELLFIDDTSNTEVPVYKQLKILEFLSHDYAFSNRLRHINATIPQSAYDELKTHNSDSHKMKNDRKMFAKQYYQYLCDIFSDAKNLQSFSWIVSGPSYDRVMDSVSKNITDLTIRLMDNEDVVDGIFQRSAYINKVKKLLKFKNLKSLNFIYIHYEDSFKESNALGTEMAQSLSQVMAENQDLKKLIFSGRIQDESEAMSILSNLTLPPTLEDYTLYINESVSPERSLESIPSNQYFAPLFRISGLRALRLY